MERATASHAVGDGADDDDDENEMITSFRDPLYSEECSQVILYVCTPFMGFENCLYTFTLYLTL